MTLTIPVWLMWTLYIVGGIAAALIIGIVIGLAIMGGLFLNSLKNFRGW